MRMHTTYMGLELNSPIVVSACTLKKPDNILQMEDYGAGAVVMPSLFEEQIRKEEAVLNSVLNETTHAFAEAMDYFPGWMNTTSASTNTWRISAT